MNRNLCLAAFAVGLLAVVWVGIGYLGTHPLALAMTLVIGAVYVFGARELKRFHDATASLDTALGAIPPELAQLDDWLAHLHPSLRNAVRLRVEGERTALPGPARADVVEADEGRTAVAWRRKAGQHPVDGGLHLGLHR